MNLNLDCIRIKIFVVWNNSLDISFYIFFSREHTNLVDFFQCEIQILETKSSIKEGRVKAMLLLIIGGVEEKVNNSGEQRPPVRRERHHLRNLQGI